MLVELLDSVASVVSRVVSVVLVAVPEVAVGEDVGAFEPVVPEPVVAPGGGVVEVAGADGRGEPLPEEPPEPPGAAGAPVGVAVGVDRCVGVLVGDGAGGAGGRVPGAPPDPRLAPTTLPGAGS